MHIFRPFVHFIIFLLRYIVSIMHKNYSFLLITALFEGLILFLSDALFLSTFDLPWLIPAYKTTLQLPIIKLFDS